MKIFLIILSGIILASCVSVNNDRNGFFPQPRNQEDNISWEYNKYNLMDSPDGSTDPTAKIKIWGATY